MKERRLTRMKSMKPLVLLAAAIIAGAALAQDQGGPPPPGDQGGPPTGMGQGPGRMRRGGPMAGPAILRMKEVQKELNLTDDQISQVNALLPARGPQPPSEDGTPPKRLSADEMEAKLKGILNGDQFTRFHQL